MPCVRLYDAIFAKSCLIYYQNLSSADIIIPIFYYLSKVYLFGYYQTVRFIVHVA